METQNFVGKLSELANLPLFDQIIEFEKRYLNTFLLLRFPNFEPEYYFLEEIIKRGEGKEKDKLIFSNKKMGKVILVPDSNVEISVVFPKVGLYTHQNSLIYFGRYPERQWKRAPCSTNTWVTDIGRLFFSTVGNINIFKDDILDQTLVQSYPNSLEQACTYCLNNPEINGIAVSPYVGITLPPIESEEDFILFYMRTPVAFVSIKNQTINIKYRELQQEIIDFLAKTGEVSKWKII